MHRPPFLRLVVGADAELHRGTLLQHVAGLVHILCVEVDGGWCLPLGPAPPTRLLVLDLPTRGILQSGIGLILNP